MGDRYYVTDTALSERFPIYTRANVGEVFPDPVTPLTSTSALWEAELGWRDAWERMGAFELSEFPDGDFCQLGVQGGYCYLNASLIRLFGERAPGLSWQDMDAQFFGAQPGIPPYEEMAGDVRPDLSEKIGATFQWVFGQTSLSDLTQLTEDRARTKQMRADRPDFTTLSLEQCWQKFLDIVPVHRHLFAQHLFTTYMATVPVGVISGVATAVGRPDLIMPIIAGIGEVGSAEPSHAMWRMSRMPADSAEFRAAFDGFLYEFGSRGPNEWESRSPTWETRPALALAAIDRMRLSPDDADPARHHAERGLELDPLDPFINFNMGRSFWLTDEPNTAALWLDRATQLNPNYAQGFYARAFTAMLVGEQAHVDRGIDAAVRLSPLDPLLYGMLGVRALALMQAGRHDEAADWADRAAAAPGAHFLIAMIALVANGLAGREAQAQHWLPIVRRRRPGANAHHFFAAFPIHDPAARRRLGDEIRRRGL